MISFMLAVLGSVTFWIVYFGLSLFVGTLLYRYCAPKSYNWLVNDICQPCEDDTVFSEGYKESRELERAWHTIWMIIFFYIFWPFISIAITIGFIFKNVLFKSFIGIIKIIDKNIPDIQFKKKETDET